MFITHYKDIMKVMFGRFGCLDGHYYHSRFLVGNRVIEQ